MARVTSNDFVEAYAQYVELQQEALSAQMTDENAWFSSLRERTAEVKESLLSRRGLRAVKRAARAMLRRRRWRPVAASLHDEMRAVAAARAPTASADYPPATGERVLQFAKIINESLTKILDELPSWIKASLHVFGEIIELLQQRRGNPSAATAPRT